MNGEYNRIYTPLDAMGWYITTNSTPYQPSWKRRMQKHRPITRIIAVFLGVLFLLFAYSAAF